MDLKMMLSVLAIAILGFIGVYLLIPEEVDDGVVRLPWLVEQDVRGRTKVFGFTLGETTLGEVRRVFGEEGEINLFAQLGALADREHPFGACAQLAINQYSERGIQAGGLGQLFLGHYARSQQQEVAR